MYSEELEKLIDYALADGVITDKEKAVLFKKAKTLGIDKDEFELVLDGKLFTSKNGELQKKKKGLVCSDCGAQIMSFELKCTYCGNEIRDIEANKFIQSLSEKLINARQVCNDKFFKFETDRYDEIERIQSEIIRNFILPNTYTDLVDAFYFIGTKSKIDSGAEDPAVLRAWRKKFKEVYSRLQSFVKNSKELETFRLYYNEMNKATLFNRLWYGGVSLMARKAIIAIVIFIAFFALLALLGI